jgi:hypothetical protein
MKKRRIAITTPAAPHFIGCWSAIDAEQCRRMIDFFETRQDQHRVGSIVGGRIDHDVKNSTDMPIQPGQLKEMGYEVFNLYFEALHDCFRDYCDQWVFLKSFVKKLHVGTFNMQRYDAGGHFAGLHSEKMNLAKQHRALVWMTYLNDVAEGGETEFTHFDLKLTPEAGKTLIWPAEWTHAHRGCAVPAGPKYIVTGWFDWPYNP